MAKTLTAVFTERLGLKHSAVDHSIFFRCSKEEHAIIAVATDNMAVCKPTASSFPNMYTFPPLPDALSLSSEPSPSY